VISAIKLAFWSENCQETLVVKSNHEGTLQCSVFGHSVVCYFIHLQVGKVLSVIQSCFNQQYLWLVLAIHAILEREKEIK
jgi:hypothetical protein